MQRVEKYLPALLGAAACVLGAWLFVRFALPPLSPFITAFAIAAALERAVRALISRGMGRRRAAAFVTLYALAVLLAQAHNNHKNPDGSQRTTGIFYVKSVS